MPNLFPVFNVPSALVSNVQNTQNYNPAPLWDFEKGDFVTNGSNQTVYGSGYDAWGLWCVKIISTQRFAHLAYSGNIGIEADEAFKEPDRKSAESAFKRTVTEALLADPANRTRQVGDFKFTWQDNGLNISCVVYGYDGNSAAIQTLLSM